MEMDEVRLGTTDHSCSSSDHKTTFKSPIKFNLKRPPLHLGVPCHLVRPSWLRDDTFPFAALYNLLMLTYFSHSKKVMSKLCRIHRAEQRNHGKAILQIVERG